MMDMRCAAVALLATLALATPHAGNAQEISKDLNLITLRASLKASTGLFGTTVTDLGLGYEGLATDSTAVGLSLDWRRVDSGGFVESSSELGATLARHLRPRRDGSPFLALRGGVAFANKNDPEVDGNNPPFLGASFGYLKVFGNDREGAGFRAELLYTHRFCGERIVDDMIFQGHGVDDLSLAFGFTVYFRQRPSARDDDVVGPPAVR